MIRAGVNDAAIREGLADNQSLCYMARFFVLIWIPVLSRLILYVYFVGGYGVDNVGAGIAGREQLRRWVMDLPGGVHIAWLYQPYIGSASGYAVVDVLRAMPGLAVAQDLADGAIFRVQER